MELEENPIVVKRDNMSWGINWRPMIIVAPDKSSVRYTYKPEVYELTTIPMIAPLARIKQRMEKKATINLPPSSPSRGPKGRMVRITP